MDNVVEALYMAVSVLIFLLALSLTLSSFSTFRNDLEDLILADERVDAARMTDSSGNTTFINYLSGESENRVVGVETVIDALYRVRKENYKVIIKFNSSVSGQVGGVNPTTIKDRNNNDVNVYIFDIPSTEEGFIKKDLYTILKEKNYKEYTGIYYQEDVGTGTPDVSDANKKEARIITYEEI